MGYEDMKFTLRCMMAIFNLCTNCDPQLEISSNYFHTQLPGTTVKKVFVLKSFTHMHTVYMHVHE